jgi:transposase
METMLPPDRGIRRLQTRQIGALPLVEPILTALAVRQTVNDLVSSEADVDLGQSVVLLVLNRLLAPRPLDGIQDWLAGTVLPEVLGVRVRQAYDNRFGRALDRLHPQLGELWRRIVSRAIQVYELDLTALHWDLTSIYFEGAYVESRLAAYGYSRDQRPDTKQINLEVAVTHEGAVPLLYQVLTGNTADISRSLPHVTALRSFLARPELAERHLRPLLISDCKLITPESVWACHEAHLYYLAPLADNTASEAALRSVTAAELAAQPLAYRPQRARPADWIPCQGVWRPFTFATSHGPITDRVLVVWSAGKERLDIQKRKAGLKRWLNHLAHIQRHLNTRRYKQRAYVEQRLASGRTGNPYHRLVDVALTGEDGALTLTFAINRSQLAAAQQLDGRYGLVTNAAHLDADQALTLYKGQDRVEKRFRTIKGPLLVHPLFVHRDERIEGLVWVSLLALLVRALLERQAQQHGLAATADRLCDRLATVQAVDITWADGQVERRLAELTPDQAALLCTLGCPQPTVYTQLGAPLA